jgi:hypothetical protein
MTPSVMVGGIGGREPGQGRNVAGKSSATRRSSFETPIGMEIDRSRRDTHL